MNIDIRAAANQKTCQSKYWHCSWVNRHTLQVLGALH